MKKINKIGAGLLLSAVSAALCASSANAQILVSGGSTFPNAPASVAGTGAGGTSVGSIAAYNYQFGTGGVDTGTFAVNVYSGDSINPLLGLTFIYTITVTGGTLSTVSLDDGYWGSSVYVAYGNSGGTPTYATYGGGNTVVNFAFNDVTSGTYYLIVGTSAAFYQDASATLIDDGDSPSEPILAPVPEASTVMAGALMLLPLGIGAIRAIRKDRTA